MQTKTNAILLFFGASILLAACDRASNKLVGHAYYVQPVNTLMKLKLNMSLTNIVHEYKSNNEVSIITYIGKEATKSETQSYSFDGSVYKLGDENYDVIFKGDTAIFSINGDVMLKLEQIK